MKQVQESRRDLIWSTATRSSEKGPGQQPEQHAEDGGLLDEHQSCCTNFKIG